MLIFILVAGCKDKESPESVCENFIAHIYALEFDDAALLATEETKTVLETANVVRDMFQAKQPEIIIDACDIKGNVAICSVRVDQSEEKYKLEKQNGQWLVQWEEIDALSNP
jgi:hypothetical protein